MKILGVESSASAASAAVLVDGKIKSLQFSNTGLTHSQTLMPMVGKALEVAGVDINDIDLFAVSNGPGSFTGIRIGVAAVKGLAQPKNKKCIGVSTLYAIAKPLEGSGAYAVAVMDARCMQVYTAQFDCGGNTITRVTEDEAITIDELGANLASVKGHIVFIGDGAELVYGKLKNTLKDASLAPAGIRFQSASSVALIGEELVNSDLSNSVEAKDLLPVYLRLPQAERELKKKQSKT